MRLGTRSRWKIPDQVERYRLWLDNARRPRELLRELDALSLQTVDRAEGWGRK